MLQVAAGLRRTAERLRVRAGNLDAIAAKMEEAAKLEGLRSTGKKGTLGVPNMQAAANASRGAKVSMARTAKPWPLQRALHARNRSLPEWARGQKGLTVEAAKSWLKNPSHGGRPVPRIWADKIAAEFPGEVPAEAESWPNGIR
jgi:hypothetical protein